MAGSASGMSTVSMKQPTNKAWLEMDLNAGFPKKPEAKQGNESTASSNKRS